MKYKTIQAKLKKQVQVEIGLDGIDFNRDWLEASSVVENAKRTAINSIRNEMHKAIAELSLDDIEFKILP